MAKFKPAIALFVVFGIALTTGCSGGKKAKGKSEQKAETPVTTAAATEPAASDARAIDAGRIDAPAKLEATAQEPSCKPGELLVATEKEPRDSMKLRDGTLLWFYKRVDKVYAWRSGMEKPAEIDIRMSRHYSWSANWHGSTFDLLSGVGCPKKSVRNCVSFVEVNTEDLQPTGRAIRDFRLRDGLPYVYTEGSFPGGTWWFRPSYLYGGIMFLLDRKEYKLKRYNECGSLADHSQKGSTIVAVASDEEESFLCIWDVDNKGTQVPIEGMQATTKDSIRTGRYPQKVRIAKDGSIQILSAWVRAEYDGYDSAGPVTGDKKLRMGTYTEKGKLVGKLVDGADWDKQEEESSAEKEDSEIVSDPVPPSRTPDLEWKEGGFYCTEKSKEE